MPDGAFGWGEDGSWRMERGLAEHQRNVRTMFFDQGWARMRNGRDTNRREWGGSAVAQASLLAGSPSILFRGTWKGEQDAPQTRPLEAYATCRGKCRGGRRRRPVDDEKFFVDLLSPSPKNFRSVNQSKVGRKLGEFVQILSTNPAVLKNISETELTYLRTAFQNDAS